HQARAFEAALRERGISYVLSGSRSLFDAAEIKDLMCYLRVLANPQDDNALLRVINTPRRGLGAATIELLVNVTAVHRITLSEALLNEAFAARATPRVVKLAREFGVWLRDLQKLTLAESPADLARRVVSDLRYDDWLDETSQSPDDAARRRSNVAELIDWIARIENQDNGRDLDSVVAALTLVDIMDRNDDADPGDALALMTLHAAKGLEFPHVYLVGFEENILPHRAGIDAGSVEEERRLAYVGITRARQTLTLTYARSRRRYGKTAECLPSRFLDELPSDVLMLTGATAVQSDRAAGRTTLASLKNLLASNVVEK
ncbi:MAG: ATP-dependent helicase, partial [Gammaproteobacteria bacterium]